MPRPVPGRAPTGAQPRPAPAPTPAPLQPSAAPAPDAEPAFAGLVTTRLRPQVEIRINPLRFVVENDRVSCEFELELVNTGNAPARGVLLEATLLNAGNTQDESLRTFFENPVGKGERIVAIPPLQNMALKTQVSVTRDQVQEFEIAGKKVCVPLLAINALYSWPSGKEAQTSMAWLLGRATEAEKLAPFRLDLGPRLTRGVGMRQLPQELRV